MRNEKSEYEIHHEKMKAWNNRRAESEKKGLEKFKRLQRDPILHPSKFRLPSETKILIFILLSWLLCSRIHAQTTAQGKSLVKEQADYQKFVQSSSSTAKSEADLTKNATDTGYYFTTKDGVKHRVYRSIKGSFFYCVQSRKSGAWYKVYVKETAE